jgi:hypothetical protein
MDFTDYTWDQIEGTLLKKISWSGFIFDQDRHVSIDYIQFQARKIFTYAKEQLIF